MSAAVCHVLASNVSLFRKTRHYRRYPFSHDKNSCHPLSAFRRVIWYIPAHSIQSSVFHLVQKKKKNQPWPFMFHLHLWYMCNLSKHPRIAARQTGPVRPPPLYLLYAGCCTFFFFFSTVFSYCRHLDRWGTLVLHWRALRLDSAAQPRWSNTPFVWFLLKVCGCLHHLYVTAAVLLLEKNCCFHMMHHNA